MRFDHFIPCDLLKPFIEGFVIQEAEEEKQYKVLPGTGLVIGFQFKGRLSLIEDNHECLLARSGITGITDRFKIFKNSQNIGSVLVYFKETGASHFFKNSLHEIFTESISLDNFIIRSELLVVEEQLYEAKTDKERITVIENFLVSKIMHTETDKLVAAALALIYKNKGNIRIAQLAKDLNISQSPLEKRFRQVVGTSAKKFASIIRLKHAINTFSPQQSITQIGYEAGFYDQAHFIKEFKAFTGETPSSFFSSHH